MLMKATVTERKAKMKDSYEGKIKRFWCHQEWKVRRKSQGRLEDFSLGGYLDDQIIHYYS